MSDIDRVAQAVDARDTSFGAERLTRPRRRRSRHRRHTLGPDTRAARRPPARIAPRPDPRTSTAARRRRTVAARLERQPATLPRERDGLVPAERSRERDDDALVRVVAAVAAPTHDGRTASAGSSGTLGAHARILEAVVRERVALGLPLAEELARELREYLQRAGAAVPGDPQRSPRGLPCQRENWMSDT